MSAHDLLSHSTKGSHDLESVRGCACGPHVTHVARSLLTPQKENLNIFKDLRKAEASLYLQILSARIRLASFLFRANVPEFSSPLCSCGFGEETAQHITLYCNKFLQQRQQASFLSCEFSTLLQQPTLLKKLLLWFMSLKRLDQFNLAYQLLSEHTPTT